MQTLSPSGTRGVIFDLDGTLYRMRWFLKPLLVWRLRPHVFRLPRFLRERDRFAGREFGSREALMEAVSGALAVAERESAARMRNWIENAFYPAFVDVMPVFSESRPGLGTLLEGLRAAGIRLAVISDYGQVAQRLSALGIDPALFDTVGSSEAAGALKPSPTPLRAVADAWGIPAHEVLVVGDRDDTDGAAARAAGMQFMRIVDRFTTRKDAYSWAGAAQVLKGLRAPRDVPAVPS